MVELDVRASYVIDSAVYIADLGQITRGDAAPVGYLESNFEPLAIYEAPE